MVKPGYKQTEIGVIPEDWKCIKLGSVAKVTKLAGFEFTKYVEYSDEGNIIALRGLNVKKGIIILDDVKYIDNSDFAKLSRSKLHQNDMLFTYVGTVGGAALVDKDDKYYLAPNVALIRFDASMDPCFCMYQILSSYFYKNQIQLQIATSSQPALSMANIRLFDIAVPTSNEQFQISAVLSDMDKLIANVELLLSKKKAIKQGAMQELLTGKKRLPGFSGEWKTFSFGDLFDFIPNNAFTRAQMADSGRVKNIHYGDILTKYGAYVDAGSKKIPYIAEEIDLNRFAERCYLKSGDVIIADTAEDETVGKALEVINVDCPVLAGQHTLLCRPKIKFAPKFLGYYLNSECYHAQLLPYIVGTKVSSVSKASVAQTKLVIPEYEEQQAIAEILSNMDAEIEVLEKKLAKYRQVKQGMMQQLLTGKTRLV